MVNMSFFTANSNELGARGIPANVAKDILVHDRNHGTDL